MDKKWVKTYVKLISNSWIINDNHLSWFISINYVSIIDGVINGVTSK